MLPALSTAQNGLATAAKRYGAASTAVVAISAAASARVGEARPGEVVEPAGDGAKAGDFGRNPSGWLPLPDGLLEVLQQAGWARPGADGGGAFSLERATLDSLQAQRAFEANLRSFQAADRQLGDTLDLLA